MGKAPVVLSRGGSSRREQEVSSVEEAGAAPETSMRAEVLRAVQQAMQAQAGQGGGRRASQGVKRGLFGNVGSMIDGSQWSAKNGLEGAMNDPDSAMREPYTGQGASKGEVWSRVVERHIGQASVSGRPNGFMPGSEPPAQLFTISEGGHLGLAAVSSLAVPPQAVWLRWGDVRIRAWTAVRDSGIGVFDPSHEEFAFFSRMAEVAILRYEWLRAVEADLQAGFDEHPWAVVWRYLVLTVQREFACQHGFNTRLDKQLLEVQEEEAFDQGQALAGLVPTDCYRLRLAEQDAGLQLGARGAARQVAGGARRVAGGAGRGVARGGNVGQQWQQQLQLLDVQSEEALDHEHALVQVVPIDHYRVQRAEREARVRVGAQGGARQVARGTGQVAGGAGQGVARGGNAGQRRQQRVQTPAVAVGEQ